MSENDPYGPALAALYAQKEEIETAITLLERLTGAAPSAGLVAAATSAPGVSEIRSDTFFNLSMTKAAAKCLRIKKKPLTTRQVADFLKEGGYVSRSKHFRDTVYAGLHRLAKSGIAVRLDEQGTWGLSEWYGSSRPQPKPRKTPPAKPETAEPDVTGDENGGEE
ncbi:MAG: hypothetical protein F4164_05295 [Gemmatimonadales bacterium]|nr:hypothetical protein [Gemmatimonadales bacterium]MYG48786.1 hypothetical protein [Gemmatimonadales bacterium]MYK01202.1 hypothetical protein [Candidatus Palauibacter ramosifaciens]